MTGGNVGSRASADGDTLCRRSEGVKARPYDLPRLYWRSRFGKTLKTSLATGKGQEGAGQRLPSPYQIG
jgi:GH24 family phage-related lysozyme (muramidase)